MPVVDEVSADYADDVTFLAVAWKGSLQDTAAKAEQLIPSGRVKWGLDVGEDIFALYGVPYQPVTVLISADKTIVDAWPGVVSEDEMRAKLDALIAG